MGAEPQPQIVELSRADAPRYRELMLHAYAAAADAFTSTAEERAAEPEAWWAARIADAEGLSQGFGAIVDGRLVGTVTLEFSAKPKTRHRALPIGMFVLASRRGSGVARALVQAALAHLALRPQIRIVVPSVTDGNAPAIVLYKAFGFESFGVEPMAIATPDGFRCKRHMGLEIAPARSAAGDLHQPVP